MCVCVCVCVCVRVGVGVCVCVCVCLFVFFSPRPVLRLAFLAGVSCTALQLPSEQVCPSAAPQICNYVSICSCQHDRGSITTLSIMGWLRLVGSLKL